MDANTTKLLISTETAWGEAPSTPTMTQLRVRNQNAKARVDTVESEEINGRAETVDLIKVGEGAELSFDFELSALTYETLVAAALRAPLVNTTIGSGGDVLAGTVTLTAVGQTITFAEASDYNKIAGAKRVKISGSATPANNGGKRIVSVDSATRTITLATGSITANDDSSTTAALALQVKYARNGTTKASFLTETEFDASNYAYATGLRVNELSLDVTARELITGSVSFLGKQTVYGTSTVAGSVTAPTSTKVLSASNNAATLLIDGVATTEEVMSVSVAVANNIEERPVVGSNFSADLRYGKLQITGDLNLYFKDKSLLDKYVSNTSVGLFVPFTDGTNHLSIYFPAIKFNDGETNVEGENTDVMLALPYTVVVGPAAERYMCQVDFL